MFIVSKRDDDILRHCSGHRIAVDRFQFVNLYLFYPVITLTDINPEGISPW